MFDFSFAEMMLAGVVALIVLGPERLPIVARKTGEWVGKIQRLAANVKSELASNAQIAEFNQVKTDLTHAAENIKHDLQDFGKHIQKQTDEISSEILPAWERLPEQKTPADFGMNEMEQSLSVADSGSLKNMSWQIKSLRKQAMTRKRDMRPRYRPTPKLRSRR
ncbi:Sec-independent protein translocase protein TatB [Wielerella bovis]|uniref:Sec-independent protein translocase protein TatB n=1 Tax=Wielerella bovis TaxID=2917790 RepID=UPI0020195156|nr:Sec-independent protein translocase protein TatB [Wielerella bovis]ULJ61684.1 Sec-independent protein translocase protein TatB [Wielerella bovis]